MSAIFRALENRNYRIWAGGALVSNIGTWMQRVAQDWLVLTVLTNHSGTAVGITTGLQFLPMLLLGPYGGVLADRYRKRVILLWTQLAMGLTGLASVCWWLPAQPSSGMPTLPPCAWDRQRHRCPSTPGFRFGAGGPGQYLQRGGPQFSILQHGKAHWPRNRWCPDRLGGHRPSVPAQRRKLCGSICSPCSGSVPLNSHRPRPSAAANTRWPRASPTCGAGRTSC